MRHRPMEFDLDHEAGRVEDGLPRLDDDTLTRIEARLRVAHGAGGTVEIAAVEVEALLAALDTLRRLSNEGPRAALVEDDDEEP